MSSDKSYPVYFISSWISGRSSALQADETGSIPVLDTIFMYYQRYYRQRKNSYLTVEYKYLLSVSGSTVISKITRVRSNRTGDAKVLVNNVSYDSISHAADLLGIGHETARMRFKSKNFPQYVILPL